MAALTDCTCTGCGGVFRPKKRDRKSYCSRECAFVHYKQWRVFREKRPKRERVEKVERFCLRCGKSAGLDYSPKYCGSKCRYEAYKERRPDAIEKGRMYSRERYRSGRAYQRDLTPRPCKCCEQVFTPVPGDGRTVFCSTRCYKRHGKRVQALKNPNCGPFRRRARQYGVAYVPGINWRLVMERDGNKCCLCGFTVPALNSRTNPLSPTVDHIVPMARGGGHTWDNVQLAHRICNSYKCQGTEIKQDDTVALLQCLQNAGVGELNLACGQTA